MSAEDNGALQKIMNKLEDSISKVNYNASTQYNTTEKEKPKNSHFCGSHSNSPILSQ